MSTCVSINITLTNKSETNEYSESYTYRPDDSESVHVSLLIHRRFIDHVPELILIELEHIKVNDKEKVILIIDLCIDLLTSSIVLTQSLFQKLKRCL